MIMIACIGAVLLGAYVLWWGLYQPGSTDVDEPRRPAAWVWEKETP